MTSLNFDLFDVYGHSFCVCFLQHNQDKIAQVYQPIRQKLLAKTQIGIPEILAARDGKRISFIGLTVCLHSSLGQKTSWADKNYFACIMCKGILITLFVTDY